MIAANDKPIAIAPIPICRALTHVGDFAPIILVVVKEIVVKRGYT
jgi:hypothetical protein